MGKRKNFHDPHMAEKLSTYADKRALDFHRYSKYHLRLMDGGFTTVDIWTTGKYYVLETSYIEISDKPVAERGGEKGMLLSLEYEALEKWLDKLFYLVDNNTPVE